MVEELLQPEAEIDGWHVSMNVGEVEEVRFKNKLYTASSSCPENPILHEVSCKVFLFLMYAQSVCINW